MIDPQHQMQRSGARQGFAGIAAVLGVSFVH
jgi:hypothetical protein